VEGTNLMLFLLALLPFSSSRGTLVQLLFLGPIHAKPCLHPIFKPFKLQTLPPPGPIVLFSRLPQQNNCSASNADGATPYHKSTNLQKILP